MTDVQKVRLIIQDKAAPPDQFFTDADIEAFLEIEGEELKLAAAMALESMATQQALLLKVIKVLDLQTDGAKLASALKDHADRLRKQVSEGDVEGAFDIAEQILSPFAEREHLYKLWLKEMA